MKEDIKPMVEKCRKASEKILATFDDLHLSPDDVLYISGILAVCMAKNSDMNKKEFIDFVNVFSRA